MSSKFMVKKILKNIINHIISCRSITVMKYLRKLAYKERFIWAHSFRCSSPRWGRPIILGFWWATPKGNGRKHVAEETHFMTKKQKRKRKGQKSHSPLQGHSPSDLGHLTSSPCPIRRHSSSNSSALGTNSSTQEALGKFNIQTIASSNSFLSMYSLIVQKVLFGMKNGA
jgi:hypothetical protein